MKLFIGAKAIIVHNNKVLVLREASYEEGTNTGLWDVPGGRINSDEPILEGLAREVKEESGLSITPGEVLGVFETFPEIKGELCHIVRVFYKAEADTTDVFLSADHDAFTWVGAGELNDTELVSSLPALIEKALTAK